MIPENYLEVLNATNTEGVSTFVNGFWLMKPETFTRLKGAQLQRAIVEKTLFMLNPFIRTSKYASDAFLTRLNPKVSVSKLDEKVTVTMNACPLLCLPGINPSQELAELKLLMDKMKQHFLALHEAAPDYNKSFGFVIATRSNELLEFSSTLSPDEEEPLMFAHKDLNAMIAGSETLMAWRNNVEKMMRKLGPYSWATFAERDFFETTDCPIFKKFLKREKLEEKVNAVVRKPLQTFTVE